jgi:hypothetical protein
VTALTVAEQRRNHRQGVTGVVENAVTRGVGEHRSGEHQRLVGVGRRSRVVNAVSAGQYAAANRCHRSTRQPRSAMHPTRPGRRAGAFAGVASDGRPLATLLSQPSLRRRWRSPRRDYRDALGAGLTQLTTIARRRSPTPVASPTVSPSSPNRSAAGYVRTLRARRVLAAPILAGRVYRWNRVRAAPALRLREPARSPAADAARHRPDHRPAAGVRRADRAAQERFTDRRRRRPSATAPTRPAS